MTKEDIMNCAEQISGLIETFLTEHCEVKGIKEENLCDHLDAVIFPTEQRVELLSAKTGGVEFGIIVTPFKVKKYGSIDLSLYPKTDTKISDLVLGVA